MEVAEITTEKRSASAPTSWDLMKTGGDYGSDAGVPVTTYLAENLSVVTACVTAISETAGMLPGHLYRKLPDGSRVEDPQHPIARLFSGGEPNDNQTTTEFVEMLTAHCLLRGN